MVDETKLADLAKMTPGEAVYSKNCASCHSPNKEGNLKSGYPSLVDLKSKRDRAIVADVISKGKGMMPGFGGLTSSEKQSLIDYLFEAEKKEVGMQSITSQANAIPYKMTGYNKFLDKNGYPAVEPPWGTLSAINLNTGDYVWKRPLGEDKKLTAKGIPITGLENYGGGVVTAGGLFIIGATKDETLRIFDKKTGEILWQTELPASAFATPSTYEVDGIQYIVIACGGNKLGTKKGDSYVAFALKKEK
jgi:quinoprotein glucose dehydrogenase